MNRNVRVIKAAPQPDVPIRALQLAEDVQTLDDVAKLLSRVDPESISEDTQDGAAQIRLWRAALKRAREYARNKLRKDYLIRSAR